MLDLDVDLIIFSLTESQLPTEITHIIHKAFLILSGSNVSCWIVVGTQTTSISV